MSRGQTVRCPDSPTGKHEPRPENWGDNVCIWCLEVAAETKQDVYVSPLGKMEASCNAYGCKQTHGREIRIGVHVTRLCDEHLAELRRQLRA